MQENTAPTADVASVPAAHEGFLVASGHRADGVPLDVLRAVVRWSRGSSPGSDALEVDTAVAAEVKRAQGRIKLAKARFGFSSGLGAGVTHLPPRGPKTAWIYGCRLSPAVPYAAYSGHLLSMGWVFEEAAAAAIEPTPAVRVRRSPDRLAMTPRAPRVRPPKAKLAPAPEPRQLIPEFDHVNGVRSRVKKTSRGPFLRPFLEWTSMRSLPTAQVQNVQIEESDRPFDASA